MWQRVSSWRFWTVIGLAVLDWVVFVVPLVPLAIVVGAVAEPNWLRRTARFLDALADGR